MRQFYLQNEYGEQIAFQGGDIFLWQPSGLGYANDNQYEASGNYFIKTDSERSQDIISGTLIFMPGEQYNNYFDFANWVFASKSLKLAYKPADEWYLKDVDIIELAKDEINEMNLLEIPVKFASKTPWYLEHKIYIDIGGDEQYNQKMYTYQYPYRYSNVSRAGVATFTLPAQLPSGFVLTIDGAAFNPIITARIESTGKIIGRIDLSAMSAQEGEQLYFSTLPETAGAYLINDDGRHDLTSFLSLDSSIPTYFDIPPGVPVIFEISASTPKGLSARLTINRYYRTV